MYFCYIWISSHLFLYFKACHVDHYPLMGPRNNLKMLTVYFLDGCFKEHHTTSLNFYVINSFAKVIKQIWKNTIRIKYSVNYLITKTSINRSKLLWICSPDSCCGLLSDYHSSSTIVIVQSILKKIVFISIQLNCQIFIAFIL